MRKASASPPALPARPPGPEPAAPGIASFGLLVVVGLALLVPLGFLAALWSVRERVRAACAASERAERIYWCLQLGGQLLFVYAALVLTLLAGERFLPEPWDLAAHWPALSRFWYGTQAPLVPVLLDVALALLAALSLFGLALWFGHLDDAGVWQRRGKRN